MILRVYYRNMQIIFLAIENFQMRNLKRYKKLLISFIRLNILYKTCPLLNLFCYYY